MILGFYWNTAKYHCFFVIEWLLILLSSCSTLFIVFVILVVFFIIKHHLRIQKYQIIRRTADKKFVPGKTAAYFQGYYEKSYPFIPTTHPVTVQVGKILDDVNSISKASCDSLSPSSTTTFERKSMQADSYRRRSFDDRLFRRPKDVDLKRKESPLTLAGVLNLESPESRPSSRGSTHYNLPIVDNVYLHSEYLHDEDDDEPIINFDQEMNPTEGASGYGSLRFQLQYDSSVPELLITVKHALDLPSINTDSNERVNSYVNLCLVPEDFLWKRTRVINNESDPVFNEKFEIRDVLHHKLREYLVCFYVMDSHCLLGERVIGKVLYPLSDLRAEQIVDVCKEISPP